MRGVVMGRKLRNVREFAEVLATIVAKAAGPWLGLLFVCL
jgi:hypothetical protein